mmetsp:Transcript_8420/g.20964  ORF Transcript_8420/g.20964 Transcript_8420/m.20964 type:complete len:224 (+) Transcript_8420:335-1006(+)
MGGLFSRGDPEEEFQMNCLDKTFRRGFIFRVTSIINIATNFVLFVIGFVILAFGTRLGYQERQQIAFFNDNADSGTFMVLDELETSLAAMSGLTIGLTIMGAFAIAISIVGMCGSVRGSGTLLYCYTIMLVISLVSQAGVVGALSSRVADIDKYSKEMIEESAAAKALITRNGRQALFLGAFLIVVQFLGFLGALVLRFVIKRMDYAEEWGNEMSDLQHIGVR